MNVFIESRDFPRQVHYPAHSPSQPDASTFCGEADGSGRLRGGDPTWSIGPTKDKVTCPVCKALVLHAVKLSKT